jgi:hypothetical protein
LVKDINHLRVFSFLSFISTGKGTTVDFVFIASMLACGNCAGVNLEGI